MSDRLEAAIEAAQRWAIFDPDHRTRGQIDRMVDEGNDELIDLFESRLQFGTAGLRGPVGPGPNRMNALIVRQTALAVVRWLRSGGAAGSAGDSTPDAPTVVIGYDARHDSADFAAHAAAAARTAGADVRLADRPTPTPIVAHALLDQAADAAFVITASHNPPADNGFKLYAGDGMQIVPPAETEIAAEIDAVAAAWADFGPAVDDTFADGVTPVDAGAWIDAHRAAAVGAAAIRPAASAPVSVVYTAMHGVGAGPTLAAFEAAGLPAPAVVASQAEPDPDFPTVAFPNPEEPGALDEAQQLAASVGAEMIVAHDPDADRLAVAAGTPSPNREMRPLSGDQLGVLLGDHLLTRLGERSARALVACSIVSSRQLAAVAAGHGATAVTTLTGFKWIARAAVDHPELEWCFGYEEAIGYCVGSHVRDKDGITAALVAVDMVQQLADRRATVWDRLDELAAEHGVYESRPVTVRYDDDPERVHEIVDRLVADPPERLGEAQVTVAGPIGQGALPPTSGVEIHTTDGSRVIVRPSGTEPKVKAYLEVIEPVDGSGVAAARAEALVRLDALAGTVGALLR